MEVINNKTTKNFIRIEIELIELMVRDKLFLNKDLTLVALAEQLQTNVSYLSLTLNQRFEKNFNDYINSYRVKEACSLMDNAPDRKLTIEGIANLSGFNTRSTFYKAFSKELGVSPTEYQQSKAIKQSGELQ
jgi:YesN/AraC family two-component response regulator